MLFDGRPAFGKSMEIDGQRFTIIGVVPDASVLRTAAYGDIWTPVTTSKSTDYRGEMMGSFNAVLLVHDQADRARVKKIFADMVPRIPVTDPKEFTAWRVGLDTKFEAFARDLMGPMPHRFRDSAPAVLRTVLLALAVLFMTLPALNLVTRNLSRILERGSEIGVRKAFGAPRRALVSQFVLENVILSLIGGVIAYLLAALVLAAVNSTEFIPYTHLTPNLRVFGYGMLVAAFFGVFSGAYPAWRMSRLDPVTALRGGVA
jgi:putative ABC transport system permease protein